MAFVDLFITLSLTVSNVRKNSFFEIYINSTFSRLKIACHIVLLYFWLSYGEINVHVPKSKDSLLCPQHYVTTTGFTIN